MDMKNPGLGCMYDHVNHRLQKYCGQLILAIRQRMVVCGEFELPCRDLCLGTIAMEPRGVMISDDGIIIPTSAHVKSQDNVCIKKGSGDIVLPEFFPMDTVAPWNLLTGNDDVTEWLHAQPHHPYLASDLFRALRSIDTNLLLI